jgi:hypothetical protein
MRLGIWAPKTRRKYQRWGGLSLSGNKNGSSARLAAVFVCRFAEAYLPAAVASAPPKPPITALATRPSL